MGKRDIRFTENLISERLRYWWYVRGINANLYLVFILHIFDLFILHIFYIIYIFNSRLILVYTDVNISMHLCAWIYRCIDLSLNIWPRPFRPLRQLT